MSYMMGKLKEEKNGMSDFEEVFEKKMSYKNCSFTERVKRVLSLYYLLPK